MVLCGHGVGGNRDLDNKRVRDEAERKIAEYVAGRPI